MLLVGCAGASTDAQPVPDLAFETIGPSPPAPERLFLASPDQLRAIVRIVGLEEPGDPILVVLASEESDVARSTPSWIAGFAHSRESTVVLFPARSPRYPHDSLEAVLYHELAHVLIWRAAGERPVPRWFNEGLATVTERAWHVADRRQLAWALATSGTVEMERVDQLFGGREAQATTAYAFAGAFVRHIMDTHGWDAPARILARVSRGEPFAEAYRGATGEALAESERTFHQALLSWERWIPLLTSPFVLWTAVTRLALYAIHVARRRRAERRRKWDEEEEAALTLAAAGPGHPGVAVPDQPDGPTNPPDGRTRRPETADLWESDPDDEPPRRGGLH